MCTQRFTPVLRALETERGLCLPAMIRVQKASPACVRQSNYPLQPRELKKQAPPRCASVCGMPDVPTRHREAGSTGLPNAIIRAGESSVQQCMLNRVNTRYYGLRIAANS